MDAFDWLAHAIGQLYLAQPLTEVDFRKLKVRHPFMMHVTPLRPEYPPAQRYFMQDINPETGSGLGLAAAAAPMAEHTPGNEFTVVANWEFFRRTPWAIEHML